MSVFHANWLDAAATSADLVRAQLLLGKYPCSANMIITANTLARHAHTGQTDKNGDEYINHPWRIGVGLYQAGYEKVIVALGWLHDVVEDTGLSIDEVMAAFPLRTPNNWTQDDLDRLRAGLDAITHRQNEPREDYYARVMTSPEALIVKDADINDNTSPERVAQLDEATRIRLAAKYAKARKILGFDEPVRNA